MATKCFDFLQGSEVFNTYGELPNWQLLHMYGFAEAFPNNIYDAVSIEFCFNREFLVPTAKNILGF